MAESDPVYARNTANSGEADVVITGFVLPGGESTAALLRRAEQERDWAQDEVELRKRQLEAARYELRAEIDAFKRMRAERDEARAELAAMRAGAT
jgi:hypothetical protein